MEEIRDMNLQLFAEGAGGEAGAEGQSKGRGKRGSERCKKHTKYFEIITKMIDL